AGAVLTHLVSINFRGTWVRLGTFDDFEYGSPPSLWLAIAILLVGFGVGSVIRVWREPRFSFTPTWSVILSCALILAGVATWLICQWNRFASWSSFAPTRHVFLIIAGAISAVSLYLHEWRPFSYEKARKIR